jgi:hypothetical protein
MSPRANPASLPKREKERERFYLFAGMGGRAARHKHKRILWWSIVIGILVSALLAGIMYLFNRVL